MEFAALKRRELQALCKRHGLAGGGTNAALVARLTAALTGSGGAAEEAVGVVVGKGCMKRSPAGASGGDLDAAKRVTFELEEAEVGVTVTGRGCRRSQVLTSPAVAKTRGRHKAGEAPPAAKGERRQTRSQAAAGDSADESDSGGEAGADAPVSGSGRNAVNLGAGDGAGRVAGAVTRKNSDKAEQEEADVGDAVGRKHQLKRKTRENDIEDVDASGQVGVSRRSTRSSGILFEPDASSSPVEKKRGRRKTADVKAKTCAKEQPSEALQSGRTLRSGVVLVAPVPPIVSESKKSTGKVQEEEPAVEKVAKAEISGRNTRSSSVAPVLPIVSESKKSRGKVQEEEPAVEKVAKAEISGRATRSSSVAPVPPIVSGSKKSKGEVQEEEPAVEKVAKAEISGRTTRSSSVAPAVASPRVISKKRGRKTDDVQSDGGPNEKMENKRQSSRLTTRGSIHHLGSSGDEASLEQVAAPSKGLPLRRSRQNPSEANMMLKSSTTSESSNCNRAPTEFNGRMIPRPTMLNAAKDGVQDGVEKPDRHLELKTSKLQNVSATVARNIGEIPFSQSSGNASATDMKIKVPEPVRRSTRKSVVPTFLEHETSSMHEDVEKKQTVTKPVGRSTRRSVAPVILEKESKGLTKEIDPEAHVKRPTRRSVVPAMLEKGKKSTFTEIIPEAHVKRPMRKPALPMVNSENNDQSVVVNTENLQYDKSDELEEQPTVKQPVRRLTRKAAGPAMPEKDNKGVPDMLNNENGDRTEMQSDKVGHLEKQLVVKEPVRGSTGKSVIPDVNENKGLHEELKSEVSVRPPVCKSVVPNVVNKENKDHDELVRSEELSVKTMIAHTRLQVALQNDESLQRTTHKSSKLAISTKPTASKGRPAMRTGTSSLQEDMPAEEQKENQIAHGAQTNDVIELATSTDLEIEVLPFAAEKSVLRVPQLNTEVQEPVRGSTSKSVVPDVNENKGFHEELKLEVSVRTPVCESIVPNVINKENNDLEEFVRSEELSGKTSAHTRLQVASQNDESLQRTTNKSSELPMSPSQSKPTASKGRPAKRRRTSSLQEDMPAEEQKENQIAYGAQTNDVIEVATSTYLETEVLPLAAENSDLRDAQLNTELEGRIVVESSIGCDEDDSDKLEFELEGTVGFSVSSCPKDLIVNPSEDADHVVRDVITEDLICKVEEKNDFIPSSDINVPHEISPANEPAENTPGASGAFIYISQSIPISDEVNSDSSRLESSDALDNRIASSSTEAVQQDNKEEFNLHNGVTDGIHSSGMSEAAQVEVSKSEKMQLPDDETSAFQDAQLNCKLELNEIDEHRFSCGKDESGKNNMSQLANESVMDSCQEQEHNLQHDLSAVKSPEGSKTCEDEFVIGSGIGRTSGSTVKGNNIAMDASDTAKQGYNLSPSATTVLRNRETTPACKIDAYGAQTNDVIEVATSTDLEIEVLPLAAEKSDLRDAQLNAELEGMEVVEPSIGCDEDDSDKLEIEMEGTVGFSVSSCPKDLMADPSEDADHVVRDVITKDLVCKVEETKDFIPSSDINVPCEISLANEPAENASGASEDVICISQSTPISDEVNSDSSRLESPDASDNHVASSNTEAVQHDNKEECNLHNVVTHVIHASGMSEAAQVDVSKSEKMLLPDIETSVFRDAQLNSKREGNKFDEHRFSSGKDGSGKNNMSQAVNEYVMDQELKFPHDLSAVKPLKGSTTCQDEFVIGSGIGPNIASNIGLDAPGTAKQGDNLSPSETALLRNRENTPACKINAPQLSNDHLSVMDLSARTIQSLSGRLREAGLSVGNSDNKLRMEQVPQDDVQVLEGTLENTAQGSATLESNQQCGLSEEAEPHSLTKSSSSVEQSQFVHQSLLPQDDAHKQDGTQEKATPGSVSPECKQKCGYPDEEDQHPLKNKRCSTSVEQSPFGLQLLFSQERIEEPSENVALAVHAKNGVDESKDIHVGYRVEKTPVPESVSDHDISVDFSAFSESEDCAYTCDQGNEYEGLTKSYHEQEHMTCQLNLLEAANCMKDFTNPDEVSDDENSKPVHSTDISSSYEKIGANRPVKNASVLGDGLLSSSLIASTDDTDVHPSSNHYQFESTDILDDMKGCSSAEALQQGLKEQCKTPKESQFTYRAYPSDMIEASTAKDLESEVPPLPSDDTSDMLLEYLSLGESSKGSDMHGDLVPQIAENGDGQLIVPLLAAETSALLDEQANPEMEVGELEKCNFSSEDMHEYSHMDPIQGKVPPNYVPADKSPKQYTIRYGENALGSETSLLPDDEKFDPKLEDDFNDEHNDDRTTAAMLSSGMTKPTLFEGSGSGMALPSAAGTPASTDEQPNSKLEGNEEHSRCFVADNSYISDTGLMENDNLSSLPEDFCMETSFEHKLPVSTPAAKSSGESEVFRDNSVPGSVGTCQTSGRRRIEEISTKLLSFKISSAVKSSYIAMESAKTKQGDNPRPISLLRDMENVPATNPDHPTELNTDLLDLKDSPRQGTPDGL